MPRKLVIGLTGGIGSGKSTVASILEELGAGIIDSDAMTHEEFAETEVVDTFRNWWGDAICTPDGRLDRSAMGNIIFQNSAARGQMERYLYPRLERRRMDRVAAFEADSDIRAIVLNSPLLIEFGLDRLCDVVIFVESDPGSRLERVRQRRGWDEAELGRRENLQKPLDIKREKADYTVVNNSDVNALRSQVQPLFNRLLASRSTC